MKIKNKYKNSIVEIIEEDDDIENLTEGNKYYRIWEDGEFKLYEIPNVEKDGSIILPIDTLLSVTKKIECDINIECKDTNKWNKFWETHSSIQYIIKGGFEIINDEKEK